MPRIFTPDELRSMTCAAYMDLSEADQAAFHDALIAYWRGRTADDIATYLAGDYAREGTYRRTDWGE